MDKKSYQEKLIADVIRSIEKHGGKDILSSVILTGSFGRGEPTFVYSGEGELFLKSDVEIALIYPRSTSKKKVDNLIEEVSSEFKEDLNLMPIAQKRVEKAYNFNFSFSVPRYKTIFTYDLFNGSKTIWGEDYIRKVNVKLDDIDPYEAKRLVGNRIGELVYLQVNNNDNEYLRKQWKGKVILAIGSAWLICQKSYVSSYYGQAEKLVEENERLKRVLGTNFIEDYKKVFLFLRKNGEPYEIPDKKLEEYVKYIDQYFVENKIGIPKVNSFSRYVKYCWKYMKSGARYGIIGFENKIIQRLIYDYWSKSGKVMADAEVWHQVLY